MPSSEKTPQLQLNKWHDTDYVKMQDYNYDNEKIDNKFDPVEGHKHTGEPGDAPKIDETGLEPGAATDGIIGDRTIAQATAPANTGNLTALISGIANRLKAITGESDWKTDPEATLAGISQTLIDTVLPAVAKVNKMAHGGGVINCTVSGNATSFAVTFPAGTFTTPPHVVIGIGETSATFGGIIKVKAMNVTKDGFTAVATSETIQTVNFNYLAIGS